MKTKLFTNCFLIKTDQHGTPTHVCLAYKKRGFGEGLWNGSGGKPKAGETTEETACREVEEEFGVTVKAVEKVAMIDFVLREEQVTVNMHTYIAREWDLEPHETEEMRPKWFPISEVPYDTMWASDREWLPLALSGKRIRAQYTYAREGGAVEEREITEVETFENFDEIDR